MTIKKKSIHFSYSALLAVVDSRLEHTWAPSEVAGLSWSSPNLWMRDSDEEIEEWLGRSRTNRVESPVSLGSTLSIGSDLRIPEEGWWDWGDRWRELSLGAWGPCAANVVLSCLSCFPRPSFLCSHRPLVNPSLPLLMAKTMRSADILHSCCTPIVHSPLSLNPHTIFSLELLIMT